MLNDCRSARTLRPPFVMVPIASDPICVGNILIYSYLPGLVYWFTGLQTIKTDVTTPFARWWVLEEATDGASQPFKFINSGDGEG